MRIRHWESSNNFPPIYKDHWFSFQIIHCLEPAWSQLRGTFESLALEIVMENNSIVLFVCLSVCFLWTSVQAKPRDGDLIIIGGGGGGDGGGDHSNVKYSEYID